MIMPAKPKWCFRDGQDMPLERIRATAVQRYLDYGFEAFPASDQLLRQINERLIAQDLRARERRR